MLFGVPTLNGQKFKKHLDCDFQKEESVSMGQNGERPQVLESRRF